MISSPTHSAKVSVELSGYGDSYNELVIEFMLRMTDSGSPQTWDSPAEGPEFEIAGVEKLKSVAPTTGDPSKTPTSTPVTPGKTTPVTEVKLKPIISGSEEQSSGTSTRTEDIIKAQEERAPAFKQKDLLRSKADVKPSVKPLPAIKVTAAESVQTPPAPAPPAAKPSPKTPSGDPPPPPKTATPKRAPRGSKRPEPEVKPNGILTLRGLSPDLNIQKIDWKQGFILKAKDLVTGAETNRKTDIPGKPLETLRIVGVGKREPKAQVIDLGAVDLHISKPRGKKVRFQFRPDKSVHQKTAVQGRRRKGRRPQAIRQGGTIITSRRGVKRAKNAR